MSDLSTFLEAIRRSRHDDTPRLVFADWLDEHYPNPTIRLGELPKGFNAHWHQNAMYVALGVRDLPRGRGKWSNADILKGLAKASKKAKVAWFARPGAAEFAGYPVFILEPAIEQDVALGVCRILQWATGRCPVSFNRCDAAGKRLMRITIWFTALPPMEQRMAEVADTLDEIFRAEKR